MKLTLVRHTSLQIAAGICYGQSDVDVAASFADEARNTKQKIAHMHFDAVYSSPLQRCVKLALTLNLGNVLQDERLKELNFGDWEMQAWDDMPREYFDEWAQDYANLAPPNGETFSQMQQRNIAFVDDMLVTSPQASICVVTHGGVVRSLLAHVLNMPLKGLFRFNIDYGSVTQIEIFEDAEHAQSGLKQSATVPKIHFVNL